MQTILMVGETCGCSSCRKRVPIIVPTQSDLKKSRLGQKLTRKSKRKGRAKLSTNSQLGTWQASHYSNSTRHDNSL